MKAGVAAGMIHGWGFHATRSRPPARHRAMTMSENACWLCLSGLAIAGGSITPRVRMEKET